MGLDRLRDLDDLQGLYWRREVLVDGFLHRVVQESGGSGGSMRQDVRVRNIRGGGDGLRRWWCRDDLVPAGSVFFVVAFLFQQLAGFPDVIGVAALFLVHLFLVQELVELVYDGVPISFCLLAAVLDGRAEELRHIG